MCSLSLCFENRIVQSSNSNSNCVEFVIPRTHGYTSRRTQKNRRISWISWIPWLKTKTTVVTCGPRPTVQVDVDIGWLVLHTLSPGCRPSPVHSWWVSLDRSGPINRPPATVTPLSRTRERGTSRTPPQQPQQLHGMDQDLGCVLFVLKRLRFLMAVDEARYPLVDRVITFL